MEVSSLLMMKERREKRENRLRREWMMMMIRRILNIFLRRGCSMSMMTGLVLTKKKKRIKRRRQNHPKECGRLMWQKNGGMINSWNWIKTQSLKMSLLPAMDMISGTRIVRLEQEEGADMDAVLINTPETGRMRRLIVNLEVQQERQAQEERKRQQEVME